MRIEDLQEEVFIEFESMEIIVKEVISLRSKLIDREPTLIEKTALSSFLTQFYNGIENILKRVCKFYSIALPIGETWHIELFEKFCYPSAKPLPTLIDDSLKLNLISFRRFRHFVHHGYSFKIDWKKMKEGVEIIDLIFRQFKIVVTDYLKNLDKEYKSNN
jgi:hypothetical protein